MRVIVVGGGASGMFCSILMAEQGAEVILLEKNERLGKKLYITGKGRCNFTNACTPEEFREQVLSNPKFLYSASELLTPSDVISLFEKWGMKSKTERGRRAFPVSDRSADVIDALVRQLRRNHVEVRLQTEVLQILTETAGAEEAEKCGSAKKPPLRHVRGVRVRTEQGGTETLSADAVVLATGGMSYPSTGSTGDGYTFARKLGLSVTELYPSLVPVNCKEEYIRAMQGLSLKNVQLTVRSGKKVLFDEFGELLFTHFGISGPLTLSFSAVAGPWIGRKEMTAAIDLKPAVTEEQLSARFTGIFAEHPKKALKNVLDGVYPAKMRSVIPAVAGVDDEKPCCMITREERERLVRVTKCFPLTLVSLRGVNEAVVTKGGISVKEINPRTMEAKSCPGLYCIGELLDVDAFTGGYNLQIAWCTAAACAGAVCARKDAP